MVEAEEGMFPEHARTGVAHHDAHLFAPSFLVTVHRAFGAGRFFRAKLATVQSQSSIIQQALAILAQRAVMMIATIDLNHCPDRLPFTGKTRSSFAGRNG